MAINALDFVAFGAKFAGSHTGDVPQSLQLVFVGFVEVIMGAVIPEKTVLSQKVDIAHFELFDTLNFVGIIFDYRIDTLTVTVTWDCLDSRRRWLRCWRGGHHTSNVRACSRGPRCCHRVHR